MVRLALTLMVAIARLFFRSRPELMMENQALLDEPVDETSAVIHYSEINGGPNFVEARVAIAARTGG